MQPSEIKKVIDEVTKRVIALSDSGSDGLPSVATKHENSQIGVVDSKVVSMQQLTDLPRGLSEVQIDHKSLITPAASDWLREQDISVRRVDALPDNGTQNTGSRKNHWVCFNVESNPTNDKIKGLESFDCILKASSRCVEAINNGNRVILVTNSVAIAMISLNRNAEIRAVHGTNIQKLKHITKQTGANVYVLGRESLSLMRLIKQIDPLSERTVSPPKWL